MNYEEKYNEILEWARKNKARLNGVPIEEVLPELNESEDERIREELIETINCMKEDHQVFLSEQQIERYLAWLEKQKEQKDELVYRLNGLMQDYIKEGKDEEEKEHRLKCYQLFWDALEDTNFFEQKEQKPWKLSEEQMEALLNTLHPDDPYYSELKSLYEQLLKGFPLPEDTVLFQKGVEEGRRLEREESHENYVRGYANGYKDAEKQYNESVAYHFPIMPTPPSGWGCDCTHCTNPHGDCINCPRRFSSGGTITTPNTSSGTSTLKAEG